MPVTVSTPPGTASVPTAKEFADLAAKVTALTTRADGVDARLALDETAAGTLAARVTALENAVPAPSPPPPPPPASGIVLFAADWASGTVQDMWNGYAEFRNNQPGALMSVVPGGGPNGKNALQVLQAGDPPGYAANLWQDGATVPGQDFFVRLYFRQDDTSPAGDHIVTCNFYGYPSLTYLRKMGGPTSWLPILSSYYQNDAGYPIRHWHLRERLANGRWWRFEYRVHWTDATHIQVFVRVSDDAGVLRYTETDYQQEDFGGSGNLSWGGRDTWTLASYYAEPRHADGRGHDFLVDPLALTQFGLGNNGQQGATATGLSWSFADVKLQTGDWVGP